VPDGIDPAILRRLAEKDALMNALATAPRLEDFDDDRVAAVALRAFFTLAEAWQLDTETQRILLGRPGTRTLYRWRSEGARQLPADTLERISLLIGTYKALHVLLPDATRADGWIRRENRAFGGRSALDVMRQGKVDDLYRVRRHLDAWRG
jgi:hypothetical protein